MVESSCGLLARYDDREPEPTKGDYSHGLRLQCSQLGLSRGWSEAGEFFVSCHRSLLDSLSPGARILDCARNGIRCHWPCAPWLSIGSFGWPWIHGSEPTTVGT